MKLVSGAALLTGLTLAMQAAQPAAVDGFAQNVAPFVKQNCAMCHNEQLKTGGLALTTYHDTAGLLHDREIWEKVISRVRNGEMPPKGLPRPKPEQISATTDWIEAQFAEADRTTKADPGHLTAHRLNRVEYNNTIRDLLAVRFKPAADFPSDDSGYGFDNIGDVLSVSPILMEKYLAAAKKIAAQAIPIGVNMPKPTRSRNSPEHSRFEERLDLEHTFDLPAEGDYDFQSSIAGRKEAFRVQMFVDGKEVLSNDVLIEKEKPRAYQSRVHIPFGEHTVRAILIRREPSAEEVKTAQELAAAEQASLARQIAKNPKDEAQIRLQHSLSDIATYVDGLELRGPFNPLPPPRPASYSRVFTCDVSPEQRSPQCIRTNLSRLATRAFRRPATDAEVAKIVNLVGRVQKNGLSFEQSMRVGVEAILVSPNFLYRFERDPGAAVHAVSDYELASRLSYFLWSSMPDDGLLQLAAAHQLSKPDVLHGEVRRMLQDAKAQALVDNFAGQWLELRNLDSIQPDPDEFPKFDDQLRQAMYTETQMFFSAVVHEDRSILDFIDGKYTFLNERLAKFYGIPGVTGKEFRRVDLDGTERSGILTQASVLTVTSYPTRTSPVLRGKWILENVLNAPPPPPPPGVGSIDSKSGTLSGTMRQIMEKHRANPMCASCHTRMDPLGFALENYNAIGEWRTKDGTLPIDASGVLPNGKSFSGSAELKTILAANKQAFAQCLTEKMLIYALGRGLEGYDRAATRKIVAGLAADDYRFSSLINGIVDSMPFQMGRGDNGVSTE
jgi:mono/diheme cytochrome c family protein